MSEQRFRVGQRVRDKMHGEGVVESVGQENWDGWGTVLFDNGSKELMPLYQPRLTPIAEPEPAPGYGDPCPRCGIAQVVIYSEHDTGLAMLACATGPQCRNEAEGMKPQEPATEHQARCADCLAVVDARDARRGRDGIWRCRACVEKSEPAPDPEPVMSDGQKLRRNSAVVIAVNDDPQEYHVTVKILSHGGTPRLRVGDRPNLEWCTDWLDEGLAQEAIVHTPDPASAEQETTS